MRLLTWNLRHGGGARRMPWITLSLLEHEADVVVLTEFRRHVGGQIAGVLADHGLRYQHCTEPPKGCNGVLVAARSPVRAMGNGRGEGTGRDAWPAPMLAGHAEVLAKRLCPVEIPAWGLSVVGVHVPCDGTGLGREAVFGETVAIAKKRRTDSCVLIGDFNAGRHGVDEEGATFTCTRLLGELATYGYLDAWRQLHPESREYTWFSHEGGGFRIDHAFISAPLGQRLTGCKYSHIER